MRNWKKWFKAAGIRAVKTVAQTAVGVIGARVMAKAIVRAVEAADSAYGFPAARDM